MPQNVIACKKYCLSEMTNLQEGSMDEGQTDRMMYGHFASMLGT